MVSFSCEVSRKSPCLVPKSPQTALAKASCHLTVCFFATGFRSTRCFSPSILNVTPLPVWPDRLHTPPCPEAARSAILTDITHTFLHTTSTGPRPTGQCPLHTTPPSLLTHPSPCDQADHPSCLLSPFPLLVATNPINHSLYLPSSSPRHPIASSIRHPLTNACSTL